MSMKSRFPKNLALIIYQSSKVADLISMTILLETFNLI